MPVRPQKWHAAFRMNPGAEADAFGQSAALANGNFVTVWAEELSTGVTGSLPALKAQIRDPLGNPVGGEIRVDSAGFFTGITGTVNVTGLADGSFVVVWKRETGEGDISFQRFNANGAKLGLEQKVLGGADGDSESFPSVTGLANGRFIISWEQNTTVSSPAGSVSGIFAVEYDKNGVALSGPFHLSKTITDLAGFDSTDKPDVAALKSGGFVAAYENNGHIFVTRWEYVSFGGDPFLFELSNVRASTQASTSQANASVTALSNGGWAVLYEDQVSADSDVFVRVYNASGGVVRDITVANSAFFEGFSQIAAGPDGTFLVTWTRANVGSATPTADTYARLYSNDGVAIGTEFLVNAPTLEAIPTSVTALPDGRYAIAFLGGVGRVDFTNSHTFVQIVDGRDATINGTNGNDKIAGHDTGQTIVNDIIDGLLGNDVIWGLAGQDRLTGGVGNDLLDGGAGSDRLTGGAGNDTYVLGSEATGVDIVADSSGTGDTITTAITRSLVAYAAVERLTLVAGNIDGTGNAFANVITGSSGNNRLDGGGGNDNLIGGAGNDTLDGGAGNDVLSGGAGNDIFLFNDALVATNKDRITDYSAPADTIQLENLVFTRLVGAANTTLSAAQFFAGTAAHDLDDRIIYNRATGALSYDADGNKAGGVAAVQFATLAPGLVLTSTEFVIV